MRWHRQDSFGTSSPMSATKPLLVQNSLCLVQIHRSDSGKLSHLLGVVCAERQFSLAEPSGFGRA